MSINVAIQAARFAPAIKTAAKAAAPKMVPALKNAGYAVLTATVINESIRAIRKSTHKPVVTEPKLETFEMHRPLWKKMTNTHTDETYTQGLKRRSRLIWDIVCYALGGELQWLNIINTKVIKLAFFLAGKVLTVAAYSVSAFGIALAFGTTDLSIKSFAVALQQSAIHIDMVAMAPFRAVRWVDRKVDRFANKMMAARDWRNMPVGDSAENTFYDAVVGDSIKEDLHVVVDELVTDDTVLKTEADKPEEVDIHHLVVLLTQGDRAAAKARAIADPALFGAELFAQIVEQGGDDAVSAYLTDRLDKDIKSLGLSAKSVAAVRRGYTEARVASAPTATS
jgi:hypothetical protein